jgi:hypothetical protein
VSTKAGQHPSVGFAALAAEPPTVRQQKSLMSAWGPSRWNDLRYAKTRMLYMAPLAFIFTAFWLYGLFMLATGLMRGNGDRIIMGGFIGIGAWWSVRNSWRRYRAALRDHRLVKERGSLL